jgi:site-specific DNA-methyltransferase (adenine-specific)
MTSKKYQIFNEDCRNMAKLNANSIDAVITDPPYGISYQNHYWDKDLPNKEIWEQCLRVLKPGAFALVFSSIRLMHRLMVNLEDVGFNIKDVLFWVHTNGMPKSRNIAVEIDDILGVESKIVGEYKYVQGYAKGGKENYYVDNKKYIKEPVSELAKRYIGAGTNLKPAYEPIILIQKPMDKANIAENVVEYSTGVLNFEETRIPYEKGEGKVGHNPHPKGRVASNVIRTVELKDGYDKFFTVPKVRQYADDFNNHPTLKPIELMEHLVKLVSFAEQKILDPFMGSGSTGVACLNSERKFMGYEISEEYYAIAQKRLMKEIELPLFSISEP